MFRPLFTIGPYAAFWVNGTLDILRMSGGQLNSIKSEQGCNDIWNVFELYLKQANVIPTAASGGATTVRRRAASTTPTTLTASTSASHNGTTARSGRGRVRQAKTVSELAGTTSTRFGGALVGRMAVVEKSANSSDQGVAAQSRPAITADHVGRQLIWRAVVADVQTLVELMHVDHVGAVYDLSDVAHRGFRTD